MPNQNDTFSNRLKKAMKENNLSSTELAKKAAIDKSSISNYLSGNYKAGQDNLTILAETLNVSEPWLMGYDVDADRDWIKYDNSYNNIPIDNDDEIIKKYIIAKHNLTSDDKDTINYILDKRINSINKNNNIKGDDKND